MGKIKDYAVGTVNPNDLVTVSDADTGDTKNILASDFAGAVDSSTVVYDGTTSGLAATDVQAAIDEVVSDTTLDHAVYRARLTQTGTSAPVATILGSNTIGNIVWTRTDAGTYRGTLAGSFNDDTVIIIGSNTLSVDSAFVAYPTTNYIEIKTYYVNLGANSFQEQDECLYNTFIEIRNY
jgi:hypothetical protein